MIIENMIDKSMQDSIEKMLLENLFMWTWQECSIYVEDEEFMKKDYQLCHSFSEGKKIHSTYYEDIVPFLLKIKDYFDFKSFKIIRFKANLTTPISYTEEQIKKTIHTDVSKDILHRNIVSIIYYVIDSDGDTIIYNDDDSIFEKCSPEKGKMIVFSGKRKHRPTNPKLNKKRVVLSLVIELCDEDYAKLKNI